MAASFPARQALAALALVLAVIVIAWLALGGRREALTVMPGTPMSPTDLRVPPDFYGPRYAPLWGCDAAALAQPARNVCGSCR